MRQFLFMIVAFSVMPALVPGCTSVLKSSVAEIRRDVVMRVTSEEAYKQAEPVLIKLKPGVPADGTGLTWSVYSIRRDNKIIAQVADSQGWIECMSGGPSQAVYKFGSLYGRSGQTAYGMHVFGYVSGGVNLVPRYVVKMQADIILPSEYERLASSNAPNIGWTWTPGRDTKTYLKGIKVKEAQALDFTEPDPVGRLFGKAIEVDAYTSKYLTQDKFAESEQNVKQLRKGMGLMEVIRALGGSFVMKPAGDDFMVVGMKGFLNLTGEYRAWSMFLPGGLFTVWGFGYVDNGKEIPKLALIFRNAEVFKVVNYTTRGELEKQCWD